MDPSKGNDPSGGCRNSFTLRVYARSWKDVGRVGIGTISLMNISKK
jgi:hypothetical protein